MPNLHLIIIRYFITFTEHVRRYERKRVRHDHFEHQLSAASVCQPVPVLHLFVCFYTIIFLSVKLMEY